MITKLVFNAANEAARNISKFGPIDSKALHALGHSVSGMKGVDTMPNMFSNTGLESARKAASKATSFQTNAMKSAMASMNNVPTFTSKAGK